MKRIFLYVVLGIVTFCAYILINLPVAPFWQRLSPEVSTAIPELNVFGVEGTVWAGEASVQFDQFPVSTLNWDLAVLKLFLGSVISDLSISGANHQIDGTVTLTSDNAIIETLRGKVGAYYINTVSTPQGLTLSGEFSGVDINLKSDLKWLTEATGKIEWPGGEITSRLNAGQSQTVILPPLSGNISLIDNVLWLHIHQSSAPLVSIGVKPSGTASVTVLARLFDLAGLPLPGDADLDSPVLEFEERIF